MKNHAIYEIAGWEYMKFDGRKKIFHGMTKAEFSAAKDRHFAHCRARYNSIPQGRCESLETVAFLKKYAGTTYGKIIIEGNKYLYVASPVFLHADYNKSIFAENTPKNRRKAELINKLLAKVNKTA